MIFVAVLLFCVSAIRSMPLNDGGEEDEVLDLSYLGDRVFRNPSTDTGKILEETWSETSDINPEELGEYAEGDIRFPSRGRNGLVAMSARWPSGEIPYEISGNFDSESMKTIQRAIDIYHKYTCIKFRQRTSSDTDYISIVDSNTGCWSSVGRIGGRQEVNLQSPSCTSRVGTPMHELMHALGFMHEQNRAERDDFVSIAWQNIRRGHENNFDKADATKTTGYGVPYDYRSVMHYSSTAFSVNGQPTIQPKDPAKKEKMGQREGFSKGDITKLNAMYNCPDKTASVIGGTNSPPAGEVATVTDNHDNSSNNPLVSMAQGVLGWLFHRK